MKNKVLLMIGIFMGALVLLQSQVGAQTQQSTNTTTQSNTYTQNGSSNQYSQSNQNSQSQTNVVVTSVQQRNVNRVVVTVTGTPGRPGSSGSSGTTITIPSLAPIRIPTITIPPIQARITPGVPNSVLERLKERLETSFHRRTLAFQEVIARIQANPHLTEEQKAAIVSKLTTATEQLTSTEGAIQHLRTEQDIRTLAQQLTTSGIYRCEIPAVHLTTAQESLKNAKQRMSDLVAKLEVLISKLEAEGRDVDELEDAVAELKERLADAGGELQDAEIELARAQNAETNSCTAALARVRNEMSRANNELERARDEIEDIKSAFVELQTAPSPRAN